MSALQRSYKRKQLIVHRPLQFRFVRAMLLVLLVMTASALAAVFSGIWFTLYSFELAEDPRIVALFSTVMWTIVVELILLTPFVCWFAIWLSHKIAGPLVRIRKSLAAMTKGEFNVTLHLREGDALIELADDVNRLAASLRSRMK